MATPTYPLELAGRMARKSAELFRKVSHPGWAFFGDIGAAAVRDAQERAAVAEADDRAAVQLIDDVLSDGKVTADEVQQLRRARHKVARSAAIDAQLSSGRVSA